MTVLNGQPMCKIDTRYRMLGNRHFTSYDTLRFNSSARSKYLYGNDFDASIFVKEYVWATAHYGGVTIQSSVPKGGPYTDPYGKNVGQDIFWYRVVNETDAPLELTISFDAFSMLPSPESFLKLFLPPDTMTLTKTALYNYGLDSKSFLDTNYHSPTMLQRTINPQEEYLFYIGMLSHLEIPLPRQARVATRTELVLKGQDLFYRIIGTELQLDALIPCGRIVVKK